MSEFLSYRETRQLLADKFNATQESMAFEIAAWVWLRSLVAYQNSEELGDDGLVIGDRDRFYFDAKGLETQCFDYFPKLERCYFKRADVEGFEPQDRYINGVALVQRWAAVCNGEDGARAKIRSCCPQRLTDYFPGYGGTQASVNQCDYALWPPFEMALFSLRQVLVIEVVSSADEVSTPTENNGEVMIDLTSSLPLSEVILFIAENVYPDKPTRDNTNAIRGIIRRANENEKLTFCPIKTLYIHDPTIFWPWAVSKWPTLRDIINIKPPPQCLAPSSLVSETIGTPFSVPLPNDCGEIRKQLLNTTLALLQAQEKIRQLQELVDELTEFKRTKTQGDKNKGRRPEKNLVHAPKKDF